MPRPPRDARAAPYHRSPRRKVRSEHPLRRFAPHLERHDKYPPTPVWDREIFGFSEAITYFEFAVDQLVGEGL